LGLVSMGDLQPYFTIKCITHRKDPIWLNEAGGPQAGLYKRLRYDLDMPFVLAVGSPPSRAPFRLEITAIKIKDNTSQADVWRALEAATDNRDWIVAAVDEHIDIRDLDMVLWAICHKAEPHRDTRIVPYTDLHPLRCSYMPEPLSEGIRRNQFHPGALMPGELGIPGGSTLLVNATQKWPYPPLELPTRELLDHAIDIWQKEGLGQLELKDPWYGYELGYWPSEFAEDAQRALRGEYYQTYEKRFAERVTNEDLPPGDYYQMRNRWWKYPQAGGER